MSDSKYPGQERRRDMVLDRRLSLGVILAFLIQFAAAIWWASGVDADIKTVKKDVMRNENKMTVIKGLGERLARVEVIVERIDRKLDRYPRGRPR